MLQITAHCQIAMCGSTR